MGNSTSNDAALVMVERPHIPSIESSEDIEMILNVKGEKVTLNEWPARAIAVPPPARGFLRGSVWAVNPDDDEERREIGQLLIHHSSIEDFGEPSLQLWLGLLDPAMVPQANNVGIDEAQRCFDNSVAGSKDPENAKICITIAAIKPELLTASRVEDMIQFQRELGEQPMMRLFDNTADIIRGLSTQYTNICRDLRCLRREFRTKENVFQGFVRVEKVNKEDTKKRISTNNQKVAEQFLSMNTSVAIAVILKQWRFMVFEQSLENMQVKLATANKRATAAMGRFLGKEESAESIKAKLGLIMSMWHKKAQQWKLQQRTIMRMVPHDGHMALELSFRGWKQAYNAEEREHPAKVALEFVIKGVSHVNLEADTDLVASLAACVKDGIKVLCAKEGFNTLASSRVALEMRNEGTHVSCLIAPGTSQDAGTLKRKIETKLKLIGTDLGTRVIAVPSIFTVCTGPIAITSMTCKMHRDEKVQAARSSMVEKFEQVTLWYSRMDIELEKLIVFRAWRSSASYGMASSDHRKSLDDMLEARMREAEEREAALNASKQAAKNSVMLMVRKWQLGNEQGITMEAFSVWHEFAAKEVAKRKGKAAVALSLKKFLEGETKAITVQVFIMWRKFAHHAAQMARSRNSIKEALIKALKGEERGLIQIIFANWAFESKQSGAQRRADNAVRDEANKYEQFVGDMKGAHGKELERHLSEAEERKEKAHEATVMMLRKWAAGETKGLLITIVFEWKRWVEIQNDLQRRHEAAKASVMKWIEGEDKAAVHLCFDHWVHFLEMEKLHHSREESVSEEAKKYQQFVDELKEAHGKELERHLTEAEIRKEQAHEATTLMLRKWAKGDQIGLLTTIVCEWNRFVEIQKDLQKKHEAAKVAVMKWFEGEQKAVVHLCWTHFKHFHETERIHAKNSDEAKKFDQYVNDMKSANAKELERHQTEEEKRKEQAHEATQMMLRKWAAGETKGMQMTIIAEWNRFVEIQKELIKRHEATKSQVMKFIEGEDRACVHLCFTHWVRYHETERIHITHSDESKKYEKFVNDLKDAHGKELERHLTEAQIRKEQAHEATTMMLKKWAKGDTIGLISTVFTEWGRFVDIQKDLQKRHEAAKVSVMKWFEGEQKAVVHLCWTHWGHYHQTERIHAQKAKENSAYEAYINDMKAANGRELERHQTEEEKRKEQAHEATTMMLRKWAKGETEGLMITIVAEWGRFVEIQKDLIKKHENTKAAVMKFVEGEDKAAVHLCFIHLVKNHEQEKIHRQKAKEQSAYEAFVNDQNEGHKKELERHQSEAEKRKEAAHEVLQMMLRKWAQGDQKGLMSTIMAEWERYIAIQKDLQLKHEAAKASVMKWIEGDNKAVVHMCWTHFVHYHQTEKIHAQHSDEAKKYQDFVNQMQDEHGKELERHQSEAEKKKEAAHEVLQMMLRKWAQGDVKGLLSTIMAEWERYIAIQKDLQARHEAAKVSVMKWIEGESKAVVHLCFTHWVHDSQAEKKHREKQSLQDKLDAVFQDQQKGMSEMEIKAQTAKNAVELALRKWAKGETEGLRSEVFDVWHHYVAQIAAEARQRAAVQASLKKFFEGEKTGLIHTVFEKWHKEVAAVAARKKQKAAVKESVRKFLEGESKGILHSTILEWQGYVSEQRLHGAHAKELERKKAEMDALLADTHKRYADEMKSAAERDKEAKHNAVCLALKSWECGKEKAMVDQIFHSWASWANKVASLGRQRQAVHAALLKALVGEQRAAAQLCFTNWFQDSADAKKQRDADEDTRKQAEAFQKFADEQSESHGKELERMMTDAERRKEAAHEASQMMLRKWFAGETKGLMISVVQEWRRYVDIKQDLQRRHEQAKQAVLGWVEGNDKAAVHMCFTHWVHFKEQQLAHHAQENLLSKLDQLGDNHLGWQSEQAARQERTKNAVILAVRKWEMGNTTAVVKEVFDLWHQFRVKEGAKRREQAAVKQQLEKWLYGEQKGALHLCFSSWHKMAAGQVAQRKQRTAVQMQLRQFLEGETRGLYDTCIKEWRHYLEILKHQREGQKQTEGAREAALEQKLLHDIEVNKQKDAKCKALLAMGVKDSKAMLMHIWLLWSTSYMQDKEMRLNSFEAEEKAMEEKLKRDAEVGRQKEAKVKALAAMGLKDDKAILMVNFLAWSTMFMKEKEARLQERKHEHQMDKAVLCMAGNDRKTMMGIVMKEWHLQLPDKMLMKADRDREAAAAEQARLREQHKAGVMQMMAKSMMADGMMAVHVCFGSWHKLIDEKRMKEHGGAMKKDAMKKAGDAMNKAISKWAGDQPRVLLHTIMRALLREVQDAREARSHGSLKDVKKAWRMSALHGGRHLVGAVEARELHVYLIHWAVNMQMAKVQKSNRILQDGKGETRDLNLSMESQTKLLAAWRAEASQQRCRFLGVECSQLVEQARDASSEALNSQRASDTLRTHMAINLYAAEQRAEEALEMSDKLGIVTGNLQGEMHTHNLTLDALEHEVLLLESQIANSEILGLKKSAVQRLLSA